MAERMPDHWKGYAAFTYGVKDGVKMWAAVAHVSGGVPQVAWACGPELALHYVRELWNELAHIAGLGPEAQIPPCVLSDKPIGTE